MHTHVHTILPALKKRTMQRPCLTAIRRQLAVMGPNPSDRPQVLPLLLVQGSLIVVEMEPTWNAVS
jgi:hypothetical protein